MKKYNLFSGLCVAVAAMAMLSCSRIDEGGIQNKETKSHVEFYAQIADYSTKATLTPNQGETAFEAAWEDTDQITLKATSASVFDETKPATWNPTSGAFAADFDATAPTTPGSWSYVAKYPHAADGNIPFGSERIQHGNAYNSAYDVMYGTVNYTNALLGQDNSGNAFVIPMHRLTGIAYFHITGGPNEDVVSATLEATGIAAETVAISSDGSSISASNPTNSITITFAQGTAPKATDLQLWFNVIPGSYQGLKLTITTETQTAVLNSTRSLNYVAGKLNKAILSNLTWNNSPTETLLFYEPFGGFASGDVPTSPGSDAVVFGNTSVSYTCVSSNTKIYDAILAGGESPELLVAKNGGKFVVSNIPTNNNTELTVTWNSNNTNIELSFNDEIITASSVGTKQYSATISTNSSPINLTFVNNNTSNNGRLDNIRVVAGGSGVTSVGAPVFDVEAGEVSRNSVVNISTTTEGATIFYTTGSSDYSAGDWIQGHSFTVTEDVTIRAVAVKNGIVSDVSSVSYTIALPVIWIDTPLTSLTSEDVFVIVGNNGNTYALPNSFGTSTPSVVSVTVVGDRITSTVSNDLMWNISGNPTDGYTFYVNGDDSNWLYCTNSSTGVRVGNSNNKLFDIDLGYLKHRFTSRYVGIYNSSDWRCYDNTTGNIAGQSFKFYKRVIDDGLSSAEVSLGYSESVTYGIDQITLNVTNPHNVAIVCSSSNENIATVTNAGVVTINGAGETTITASWEEQTVNGVTYRAGSSSYNLTVAKANATVAFSNPITEVEVGSTVTNVATVTPAGLVLTYSSNNSSAATVNANGVVTGVANGLAVITATFAGNDNYNAASDSYTITVGTVNDGTLDHPYTASEAYALIIGGNDNTVYVSGKVVSKNSTPNASGQLSYYISQDGTETEQIQVYLGKYLGNSAFTSADQISVGDNVVVYGTLLYYTNNNNNKAEITNSHLYSINGFTKALTAGTLSASTNNTLKQVAVTWGAATGTTSAISYLVNCGGQTFNASAAGSHTFTMPDYGTYNVTVTASASDAISASVETTATLTNPGSNVPAPETITFSSLGLENGVQYTDPFDGGNFTITFAGGTNDGKYYTTGSGIRIYGGGSMTISSSHTISQIEFTWDGSNAPTSDVADPAGYSSSTKKWTGSASSVTLTRPSGSGHWRLQSVKVTYSN